MQSAGRDRTSPPLWNFLEASKILTPRACFEKFREAWLIIAPRGPMQSGPRDRTSPEFPGGRKNADVTARTCFGKCREAWWTIAPRKPMQSGGRARTSPPLWNFLEASKILTPRACFEKFREAWLIIAPRGPMQSGPRDRTSPEFPGGRKNADVTARTCFGKCREAWWTIAPRKPMQSGGRARTSPPLWNFFGGLKNADAPRALWKISVSMVDHCSPQAYAKRGARPTEPPALEFFQMPQKC